MPRTLSGQELPSEAQAVGALAELLGPRMAEGLWDLSVRELGVARPVDSAADLRRIADHLMEAGELVRVTARSLKVRAVTYEAFAKVVLEQ